MALGDPYATLTDLKNYLVFPLSDTTNDAKLTMALASASRDIEKYCQRQFNLDTVTSARVFEPESWIVCRTDDFTNLVSIDVDPGGTGTFGQTLTSSNYELYPLNGVSDGVPGWPSTRILATGGPWFPRLTYRRRGTVRVTAQWGWPSVPDAIKQCALIIAAQKFRLADAPWGQAGMTEFGKQVRVREIPLVKEMMDPYVRYPVLGG